MKRPVAKIVAVFFITAVVIAGAVQLGPVRASTCPRPSCHHACPQIVAPVRCSDGCTFINSCYAGCAGEKSCVRTSD